MAKITRVLQKLFGVSGLVGTGGFGAAAGGTVTTELASASTPAAIMATSEFGDGWLSATLGASKFPAVEDMNALAYAITSQLAYLFQQGIAEYDATTAYFIGGLAMDAGTTHLYYSLTNNNVGNALTDPTNWALAIDFANASSFSTGDLKTTMKNAADTGWVLCNDGTIGNAASGGTARANADTSALFALLWTNVTDTYAPVSGGRGANAAADFAANKTISLTKMLGRALAISGAGASLSARTLGQTTGEETHVLITSEMPSHTHTYTEPTGTSAGAASGSPNSPIPSSTSTDTGSTGGDGAHNNMQPTSFVNVMIKL